MIVIDNVVKSFGGTQVLKGVSLDIREGEIFGIVGLSGAGKSTLIRCINMLERPSSGRVQVAGVDMTCLSRRELDRARQRIGMIFQNFNLFPRRNVRENVAFPLSIAGVPRDTAQARAEELLVLVGLASKAEAYPRQLSGGQQQRVAIARALANESNVLLCDEPTSALDTITSDSILSLLADINRKLGLTIVLITHQIHVIRAVCQRVAVIHQGQVAEQGDVEQVITRPTSAIARSLLRSEASDNLLCPGSWRLSFVGGTAGHPVLASVVRDTGILVNILAGSIDQGPQSYGWLLVRVEGSPEEQVDVRRRLEAQGVMVEVINNAG